MNERLRELSDIAYKNHMARNPNSSFGRRADYDKEFAELIVQECLRICISVVGNSDYNTGRMHCVSDLKEHFGVEE